MSYEEKMRKQIIRKIPAGLQVSEGELLQVINEEVENMADYVRLQKRKQLRHNIYNAIRKLDILQDFIDDEEVTEIMVNGKNHIFIEKEGHLINTQKTFSSQQKLEDIIQQIASKGNRIVNESNPILDVRLEDGSRVNIVLPPIALEGPVVTIRKFPKEALTMEHLINYGAITKEVARLLETLVIARYNIFISGGTGAGKTTFLNILSNYIPGQERVITIEDSAELQIQNIDNLVRLEARNANVEGTNQVEIRDLIKSALRMRPDRIIVGEVRDAVAVDMLAAFNTGHDGSLSTGHANSPMDMINRLETLVLMGLEIPLGAIRAQIASALDIIVHLGRLRDQSRKVLEINEIGKVVDGKIELIPLYKFIEQGEQDGKVLGQLKRTSHSLVNIEKCRRAGVSI